MPGRGKSDAALVGRGPELARAVHAVGERRGIVVVGEAGVGKTSLLEQALAGVRVRTGRCFRSLSAAGAAPLQQALGEPVPVGDPAWTAQWVAGRLGRAVLRIEDLQWGDPLTVATLTLLAEHRPLAVTVRTGDPGTAAALDALAGPGRVDRIDLAPLAEPDATRLAAARHPRLQPAEATALARRCGGNPLLIEELGSEPGPARSLQLSLVRRLRRMGTEPWTGFALLARAGEPLPEAWVPGLAALRAAGLVPGGEGAVAPRHPLLADAVRDHLDERPDERRDIDRLLARIAERAGRDDLAAGAYAAAGEPGLALPLALAAGRAAASPGSRAALMALAARCAEPPQAAHLATAAVSELALAGEYAAAVDLISRLPDQHTAAWLSVVGRVRWQAGDDDAALAAYRLGLELAEPGSAEELVMQLEYARALALTGGAAEALPRARAAVALAEATGRERVRALAVLGTVEHFADLPTHVERLTEAVQLAADADAWAANPQVAFGAVNNLVAALESAGDLAGAVRWAEQAAEWAEALHLRGWGQQLTAMALNARLHAGDYGPVLARAEALLGEVLDRRTRDQLEVTLGLALVDLGRTETVTKRLATALPEASDDRLGRGNLLWVASEARLWSGDALGALELAERSLAEMAGQLVLFPLVTIAHAELRLGRAVTDRPRPEPSMPVVEAVPLELAGLAARSRNEATASGLFDEAAALWRGRHRRGELRCRWLAADSAIDTTAAVTALHELETELAAGGWDPLLWQVRRSLRERGVRRSAPRGRVGELTLREREVLDLVAEGLSTDAVAARLGISPATVAALVSSARGRLGASSRWQAVSER